MAQDDYIQALKLGQKVHREKIANGEFAYLPVLDEILSHVKVVEDVPLGIMEIPLSDVVGTYAEGRTQAFAPNFMPILEYGSEFSVKWSSLYDYQIESGIADPIQVYEYMHKYYVIEGHKRVSVLKYLGASTISADVIRKVPEKTDDEQNRIYYEYLDFFAKTGINYLHFTKTGSYAKMFSYIADDDDYVLTEDDRKDVAFFHAHFEKAYNSLKDKTTKYITDDDAMLFYLSLYPYEEDKDLLEGQIKNKLQAIWSEISNLSASNPVELRMEEDIAKKSVVSSMFSSFKSNKASHYKVAFVYDKEPEESAWIYGHELGRLFIEDEMPNNISSDYIVIPGDDEQASEKIGQLCEIGYDIIFIVTPNLINASIKVAAQYPSVYIFNCQLGSTHNTVRSYYARIYEAKLLTGIIAGVLCDNNVVGYVADYPIYGVVAGINAFALGAKMVNPRIKIKLAWSSMKHVDYERMFKEEGIDIISAQEMITPEDHDRKFGLYKVEEDGTKTGLAMSAYNWGRFYKKIIEGIEEGLYKSADGKDNKAINYWWGFSAGVIDLICSSKLPDETVRLVQAIRHAKKRNRFHTFVGEIRNQAGEVIVKKGEVLQPEDIMNMDYLVENVEGIIPTIEDIKNSGKKVVELLGVKEGGGQQTP